MAPGLVPARPRGDEKSLKYNGQDWTARPTLMAGIRSEIYPLSLQY